MCVKDINIKIKTYCFFDCIVNIKDFDPNNIKVDEKSYKKIFIYYIGQLHVTITCDNYKSPKKL